MSVYLIAYGIFRFFNEYLRADDRGEFVGGISPSQFWSILMVVIGVGLIFLLKWLFKKRDEELALANGAKPEQSAPETQSETQSETEEKPAEKGEIVWREVEESATENAEATVTETAPQAPQENTETKEKQEAQQ